MGTIPINIADNLGLFWWQWNIRIYVLLTQFLRIVLFFLIPHRKSCSNPVILLLIKVTYGLSYTVAFTALTYISSGMPITYDYQPPLVLWASFILLHLCGGDGQETAFKLDEYEFWYQHALDFISRDMVMFLVILLQWRQVGVPAGWMVIVVLACAASCVKMKYLWWGRRDLRTKVLLKHRELHNSAVDVNVAVAVGAPALEVIEEARISKELDEIDLVSKAFKCYDSSIKLFLDLSLTRKEREQSRKYFLELNPKVALRMVEIELNIAYDAYYTVGADPYLTKRSRRDSIFRFIYLGAYVVFFATLGINPSFLPFSTDVEDMNESSDWIITRTLYFSTALFGFMRILRSVTSDYMIACWNLKRLAQLLSHMRRWSSCSSTDGDRDDTPERSSIKRLLSFAQSCLKSLVHIFFRRWSETISTRSFMIECLITTTGRYSSLRDTLVRWYVTPSTYRSKPYNDDIGTFIFTWLQKRARSLEAYENARQDVFELRADFALRKYQPQTPNKRSMHLPDYFDWPFEIRQLLWHIATEILYNTRDHQQGNDPCIDQCREMSNLLSQYMMYLKFGCRPIMSSLEGNLLVRFHEMIIYIRDYINGSAEMGDRKTPPHERLQKLYTKIMDAYRGDGQRIGVPVLLRAVKIAEALMRLDEKEMWEEISDEWVEMLVFAATNSDMMAHVEKLAEGGELITIVRLLSAHLGFGDYFLVEKVEEKKNKKKKRKRFLKSNDWRKG